MTIPMIAPGISEANNFISHFFQKLFMLIASAMISKGNINVIASIAVNLNINNGTANTPNAPAKADFDIPISKTTKAMTRAADNSMISLPSFILYREELKTS